jgi:hypothetical protein
LIEILSYIFDSSPLSTGIIARIDFDTGIMEGGVYDKFDPAASLHQASSRRRGEGAEELITRHKFSAVAVKNTASFVPLSLAYKAV